jgi:hypothetical protein
MTTERIFNGEEIGEGERRGGADNQSTGRGAGNFGSGSTCKRMGSHGGVHVTGQAGWDGVSRLGLAGSRIYSLTPSGSSTPPRRYLTIILFPRQQSSILVHRVRIAPLFVGLYLADRPRATSTTALSSPRPSTATVSGRTLRVAA